MERRKVLATIGTVTFSGCLSSSNDDSNGSEEGDPVLNATFEGTTTDHEGPKITSTKYEINGPCRATIFVDFAEEPLEGSYIGVKFYRNGEEVDSTAQKIGKFAEKGANIAVSYCEYERYDSFKLAVIHTDSGNTTNSSNTTVDVSTE
ncbi:hypothetical protein [Natrinema altunense]|uniref:Lipoprotein n=1 Tax=Natrinema altunense TaxID=222984 RepID=A0A482XV71_9EURY|nr:hypothetical protein [Natrinema altunense]RZH67361.1 hypothetical protein ELS17_10820 [Natrinema altunense]